MYYLGINFTEWFHIILIFNKARCWFHEIYSNGFFSWKLLLSSVSSRRLKSSQVDFVRLDFKSSRFSPNSTWLQKLKFFRENSLQGYSIQRKHCGNEDFTKPDHDFFRQSNVFTKNATGSANPKCIGSLIKLSSEPVHLLRVGTY